MELLAERETRGYEGAAVSEALRKRILFLDPVDRKMVEMAMGGTLSRRDIALLSGLSNGTVTRRLRRLAARLNDRLVGALVERGDLLPEMHREVGLAFFLRRMRLAEIARRYGLTVYEVKRVVTYVRGWHGGASKR